MNTPIDVIKSKPLLSDWLYFLEYRHAQTMQLGLARVKHVAEHLNLIDFDMPIILVAGTNGKGSTVASLEAIYDAAGYQVGSYTSPHLLRFNERIRVNKQPISDEALCDAFEFLEKGRRETHLTYFEMTTLAALWYFKQYNLDVIILEVGLGGRLDATNIVSADLAIITSVDLDHQSVLGDNREAIGYEKAGIIRPSCPLIYADFDPPQSVINQAALLQAPVYCLQSDYQFDVSESNVSLHLEDGLLLELPIPAVHVKSAVASVVATKCLSDRLPVSETALSQGLQIANAPGRLSLVRGERTTLFDVAHNVQAAQVLAEFLAKYPVKGKVHGIFSALNDKDLCGLISEVAGQIDVWYPAVLNNTERAASVSDIKQAFMRSIEHEPFCYQTPCEAYLAAIKQSSSEDLIVVFGSFFTVSSIAAEFKLAI